MTKLHIPSSVNNNLIQRANLFDKLNVGLNRKLILISAPAGFGKTTLLSDWINQNNLAAAWLSLDKGDNDPVELLSYIISSIQDTQEGFGQNAIKLLKTPNKPKNESIASLLINDMLQINQDLLLVLDDFHLIESNEVLSLMIYFLDHIPDNIHIVISTRSDPPLPLARLRSQQKMLELRSSDLCFSANEISILFNKNFKIKLSKDDINSLKTKTEGWIAGLQLTALSLQACEDVSKFIDDLKGNNQYIMDYLIEEVLKIQSDEIREFLLKISILEQFSSPLCNHILNRNDSQLILEKLEKSNMFVFPLDNERKWYRFHHLFADLLRQKLFVLDKDIIKDLHLKASTWFEQNEMYELAIDHALKVQNYKTCIDLLNKIVEDRWTNGQHSQIIKYGDLIPIKYVYESPSICLYYAWILISAIQISKAKPFLENAEEHVKRIITDKKTITKDLLENKKLLGKISVALAYLYSHEQNSVKIFQYCKIATNNLSEDDPFWFSWAWFSLGMANFSIGELTNSNEAYKNALKYGKKSGNIFLISTIAIKLAENEQQQGLFKSAYKRCKALLTYMNENQYLQLTKAEWTYAGLYSMMALIEFMWLEVDNAFENIKIASRLSENMKDISLKVSILMVYSATLIERGNTIEAEEKINELEEIIRENEASKYLLFAYLTWKAYLLLDLNQLDRANDLFEEYDINTNNKISHLNELAYITYTRLLLNQNRVDEAEIILPQLYDLATSGQRTERLIELKILYAILYKMKENPEKALSYLLDAMQISSEENLMIYFVFKNDNLRVLLKEVFRIHSTSELKISNKFIDKLKIALDRKEGKQKTQLESDLSQRELDTLLLIEENLTNQEIAEKLFISLHTVKSHVKNILFKLDVNNRAKAVKRAKELRML